MTIVRRVLILIALSVLVMACGRDRDSAGSRGNPLVLLISAEHGTPTLAKELQAALAATSDLSVVVRVGGSGGDAVAEAGTAGIDCGLLPVFEYLLARQEFGVQAHWQVVRGDGARRYRGVIVVRADARYQNAADLGGAKVAYVSNTSTTGFLLPARFLEDAGVTVTPVFAGSHDAAIAMVLDGRAEAAATFDEAPRADGLRLIAVTGEVPNEPLFCHPGVPAARRDQLGAALTTLASTADGRALLGQLAGIDGFAPIADTDYEPVRELLVAASKRLEDVVPGAWPMIHQRRVSPGDLGPH